MRITDLLLVVATGACIASPHPAVAQSSSSNSTDAAARTRAFVFHREYEDACDTARTAVAANPRSPELRAWYIVALTRSGRELLAQSAADSLTRELPSSPWTLFARASLAASLMSDKDSTLALARRAYDRRPADPDFDWMYASTLERYGEYAHAASFVDSLRARGHASAELLAIKGLALATSAFMPKHDSLARARALQAFAEAQRLDSTNVDAFYLPGGTLLDTLGDSATIALLRHAVTLAPRSFDAREQYWDVLAHGAGLKDTARRSELLADVDRVAHTWPDDASRAALLVDGYETLKDTARQVAAERDIASRFGGTPQAERVAYQHLLGFGDSVYKHLVADTAAGRRQLRDGWLAYLARPVHFNAGRLGSAYLQAYNTVTSDSTAPVADVYPLIVGTVRYNTINPQWTHALMPVWLADHKSHLAYAEKLVREGDYPVRARVKEASFMSVADQANLLDGMMSMQRDALGWVLYAEGRKAEARREFARALRYSKKNAQVYKHLGSIAEAEGRPDSAEALYAKGMQYEIGRYAHANADALKRIYASRRGGSLDGFDAFVGRLKDEERRQRKEHVLADRVKDAKAAPRFSLVSVDGRRVTSDSLKGRVAVVNFWGVWCGPCVMETPDIQKFYNQVKNDTNIVFLTISNDDDPQTVKDFMAKRKFDFPVLMDSAFVRRIGISAWPTTWFVDRDGRIQFTARGASDVLAEEFGWRVDALKAPLSLTP